MRYLMIDRVLEWTPFERVVATKNVTLESDVFEHHFPGFPLFPGALTIEAMAQAAGYLVMRSLLEKEGAAYAAALSVVERVHFRRPVHPGDQLQITIAVTDWRPSATRVAAHATGDGQPTARGRLLLAYRRLDESISAEVARFATQWMRDLERPRGLR